MQFRFQAFSEKTEMESAREVPQNVSFCINRCKHLPIAETGK
jgi:hypothetical protein